MTDPTMHEISTGFLLFIVFASYAFGILSAIILRVLTR
jgi:hypothetical protein